MAKKKTEEIIPVEEVKIPTFISLKKFIKSVFIILISFFCILIGVCIYQMNIAPAVSQKSGAIQIQKKNIKKSLTPMQKLPPSEAQMDMPTESLTSFPLLNSAKNEQMILEEPKFISSDPRKDKEFSTLEMPPREPVLKNILAIKEHLDNGTACFSDFKTIISQTRSKNDANLMEALMPICATPQANFDMIEKTFMIEKKKALMSYYLMSNPKWLAYLKTFGSSLIEIRRLHPQKQRPKDLLSLAQNALKQKNMEQALNHIQKLPQEMKIKFASFISGATQYVNAQKEVNSYILSFEGKGE